MILFLIKAMQHILSQNEFSIGNVKREAHNSARCKVVINSTNPPQAAVGESTDIKSEMPYSSSAFPSVSPCPIYGAATVDDELYSIQFYKQMGLTLSHILKSNNLKLLMNLIDQSGKVIVEISDLAKLVGLITDVPPEKVVIKYDESIEPGCLKKVSPMKKIKNIKINQEDFHMKFNKEYNILQDEFGISLDTVIFSNIVYA